MAVPNFLSIHCVAHQFVSLDGTRQRSQWHGRCKARGMNGETSAAKRTPVETRADIRLDSASRAQTLTAARSTTNQMNQITYPREFAPRRRTAVFQKRALKDEDLQIVANLICKGLREGLYAELLPAKKRSDVLRFLRCLVTKCYIRHYDRSGKCLSKRAASLCVYTVKGDIIGFGVLGQIFSGSTQKGFYSDGPADAGTEEVFYHLLGTTRHHLSRVGKFRLPVPISFEHDKSWLKNGIELLMLAVAPLKRGFGYGASILDSIIKGIANQYLNLMARCSSDNQLLFSMLVSRGFFAVGQFGQDFILRFRPPIGERMTGNARCSRYSEWCVALLRRDPPETFCPPNPRLKSKGTYANTHLNGRREHAQTRKGHVHSKGTHHGRKRWGNGPELRRVSGRQAYASRNVRQRNKPGGAIRRRLVGLLYVGDGDCGTQTASCSADRHLRRCRSGSVHRGRSSRSSSPSQRQHPGAGDQRRRGFGAHSPPNVSLFQGNKREHQCCHQLG